VGKRKRGAGTTLPMRIEKPGGANSAATERNETQ
jgi:hypothetical protein